MSEIEELVNRYENMIRTGESSWFDSVDLLDIMEYYEEQGKEKQWEEVVLRAYEMFPDDEYVVLNRASLYMTQSQYIEAERLIKSFLKNDTSDNLSCMLANIYIENNTNLQEAEEILNELIEKDSTDINYIRLLAEIKISKQDYQTAEALMRNSLKENADSREELLPLYVDCAKTKTLKNIILKTLNTIIDKEPFEDEVWMALAIMFFEEDDLDKALEAVDFALAIDKEDETRHALKANIAIANLDEETFIKESLLATEYSLEPYLYYEGIAKLYASKDDYAEALHYYQKAIEGEQVGVVLPESKFGIIECFLMLNKHKLATHFLDKVMEAKYDSQYYISFAARMYGKGFVELSEAIFLDFINDEDDRTSLTAIVALAYIQAEEEDLLVGIELLDNALKNNKMDDIVYLAMLDLSCRDDKYMEYSKRALRHIITKNNFHTEIEENYPNLLKNKNYIKCLKELLHE